MTNAHATYKVVIEMLSEEDGGGYLATVPELPGCMSDGGTRAEALVNVEDAIGCWIEAAREMGRQVPQPKWFDPDDAPEWTDEMFERAQLSIGGKVIRPATGILTKDGLRPIAEKRQEVTLRLPPNVIAHFKAGGAGWQTRIGEVLERHAGKAGRKPG